ncbi:MAG TPA: hypothetical protein ENK02_11760 [Planctomycetes bacterium]|nr:hypothetical protein [Planctomycetota bacterium]
MSLFQHPHPIPGGLFSTEPFLSNNPHPRRPSSWIPGLLSFFPALLFLLFFPQAGLAQSLLKNINPDPFVNQGSNPYHFRQAGPFAYFWASIGQDHQLWRTDGTTRNTILLHKNQGNPFHNLLPDGAAWKNLFLFRAWDPKAGMELWRSDGTSKGTYLVKDLAPGTDPFNSTLPLSSDPRNFVSLPQGMFFQAWTKNLGWTLFVTDGTSKGTIPLFSSPDQLQGLTRFGNRLVFQFLSASYGKSGLGISDGTKKGTSLFLTDPFLLIRTPKSHFPVLNGHFFFAARSLFGTKGEELWISDGTPKGTRLLKDLWPGEGDSSPREFQTSGAFCYFSAADPKHGRELWRTDGTPSGTVLVKDIAQGGVGEPNSSDPKDLVPLNKGVLFSAKTTKEGREPWFSDGTTKGTRLIQDLEPGTASSDPSSFLSVGTSSYFVAKKLGQRNLYRTHGKPENLTFLQKLGTRKNPNRIPFGLGGFGRAVLFPNADEKGVEPWISDGTKQGTHRLKDIAPVRYSPYGSFPRSFTQIGDRAFFLFDNRLGPTQIGQTDGTEKGTIRRWEGGQNKLSAIGSHLLSVDPLFTAFQLLSWDRDKTAPQVLLKGIFLLDSESFSSPLSYQGGVLVHLGSKALGG